MAQNYHRDGWNNSDIDLIRRTCQNCGISFEYPAWTLLNAEEFPGIAEMLLEGSLSETECPGCHKTFRVPHPCLYLDPINNVCIYFVVDEQMKTDVANMFTDLDASSEGPKPFKRIVMSREALREKALAFRLGMDDRIVEILKFAIRGQAKKEGLIPVDTDYNVWLSGVKDASMLMTLETEKRRLTSLMPMGAYDLYKHALHRSSWANEQSYFIDTSWAEKALDVICEEELL